MRAAPLTNRSFGGFCPVPLHIIGQILNVSPSIMQSELFLQHNASNVPQGCITEITPYGPWLQEQRLGLWM